MRKPNTYPRYDSLAPWEFWLGAAAADRSGARREYRAARRCEATADQLRHTSITPTPDQWRQWAGDHRRRARQLNQSAREAVAHVQQLWPSALEGVS